MRRHWKWGDGRPVLWLFAATVVLPSVALAVLAWRALDADQQLAEQAWRERLQDASHRIYSNLERRVGEARARADALARGEALHYHEGSRVAEAMFSPQLLLSPASAFAWIPDGKAPAFVSPPPELEAAELLELRAADVRQSVLRYQQLARSAPALWQGWVQLRLARALARAGDTSAAMAAWKRAAALPDSPGTVPSSLAARFELSANSPAEAARLYQDLHAGTWTLEKSPYAFYEEQLRTWASDRISETVRAAEQERQAMSRILERAVMGESGRLKDSGVAALVVLPTKGRPSAIIVRDSQWPEWLEEASHELPGDLRARMDAEASPDSKTAALALTPLGMPGSVWAEATDPTLPARENDTRRRLLLAILFAVAGVLAFGTFATVWIVRRELQIAQMQADFTATVSHEFRSPLTGIRQLGEMLLAGRAANDEARRRQYYELICRESDRLTRLVENVLDFSRMEDGRKEYRFSRIETTEWLGEMAAIAARRREVRTLLPEHLPAIDGDREALSSAVLNLLDNAIKYSPEGSAVVLKAHEQAGWLCIEVEDHGCGISREEQRRIFDRFYRTASAGASPAKGVGLGLALVRRIADAHGASLHVESEPGQGSTFTLSLRAAV